MYGRLGHLCRPRAFMVGSMCVPSQSGRANSVLFNRLVGMGAIQEGRTSMRILAFAILIILTATAQAAELAIATFNAEFLTRPKVHAKFRV